MIPKNKDKSIKANGIKPNKFEKQPKLLFKFIKKISSFFTNFFRSIGRYFKESWQELMQVRWPNRTATWSLTGAVLLFTAFFMLLIILLDAGFDALFNLILK